MLTKDDQPPYDAEKMDRELLKKRFKKPPGVGELPPSRSTLLVGARGSGKTMLLMEASENVQYTALYGDLRKILNGVSADTGYAGLSNTLKPSEELYLQSKSAALVGLWVIRESMKRKLPITLEHMLRLLPDALRQSAEDSSTENTLYELIENTSELPPSVFPKTPRLDELCMLLNTIDRNSRNVGKKGLILLLDRAEEVPEPGLKPVIRLMDQDNSFRVVVACRPGILGSSPRIDPSLPIPGDHFDVKHLGHAPYSDDWLSFQKEVLNAWIPQSVKALPSAEFHTLLKISRDSLRAALELVYNSSDDIPIYDEKQSHDSIHRLQAQLLDAAKATLYVLNNDLSVLLKKIRKSEGFHLPVALELKSVHTYGLPSTSQISLLTNNSSYEDSSKLEQFVRLGLRTWLLSVPDGVRWSPFIQLSRVELNPIFLWDHDVHWSTD